MRIGLRLRSVIGALTYGVYSWSIISPIDIFATTVAGGGNKAYSSVGQPGGLIQNFSRNEQQQLVAAITRFLLRTSKNFSKLGQDVWRYLMRAWLGVAQHVSPALLAPDFDVFCGLVSWPEHVKQWRSIAPNAGVRAFGVSQEMDEVCRSIACGQVLLMLVMVYCVVAPADRLPGGRISQGLIGLFVIVPYLALAGDLFW